MHQRQSGSRCKRCFVAAVCALLVVVVCRKPPYIVDLPRVVEVLHHEKLALDEGRDVLRENALPVLAGGLERGNTSLREGMHKPRPQPRN